MKRRVNDLLNTIRLLFIWNINAIEHPIAVLTTLQPLKMACTFLAHIVPKRMILKLKSQDYRNTNVNTTANTSANSKK